jgi:hypothetical protein
MGDRLGPTPASRRVTKVPVGVLAPVAQGMDRGASGGRLSRNGRESHTFAVPSALPVTIRVLSGLNEAVFTAFVCPLRLSTSAPVFASHSFTVLSALAGDDPGPVRTKRCIIHGVRVSLEIEHFGPRPRVPYSCRVVLTGGHDPRPIHTKRRE